MPYEYENEPNLLIELLPRLEVPVTAAVRPHLRAGMVADQPELESDVQVQLLVNARLVPSLENLAVLRSIQSQLAQSRPADGTGHQAS